MQKKKTTARSKIIESLNKSMTKKQRKPRMKSTETNKSMGNSVTLPFIAQNIIAFGGEEEESVINFIIRIEATQFAYDVENEKMRH